MGLIQLGGDKAEEAEEGPPLASPGGEISFSVRAVAEARKLLELEGGKLFRVGVSEGGCSGIARGNRLYGRRDRAFGQSRAEPCPAG